MNFELPKIYPITDTHLSGLTHREQVERLVAGGATLIQLREKSASARTFYEDAKAAMLLAHRHKVRIIINDRADIALTLAADGVHLGQDDMPADEARRILGNNAIVGLSTHSVEQARHALSMPVDYIAIGPIFPTKTKENPDDAVGLDGLREVRKAVGTRFLVAIGGITDVHVAEVLAAGADSAAVIGTVVSDADSIAERIRHMIEIATIFSEMHNLV